MLIITTENELPYMIKEDYAMKKAIYAILILLGAIPFGYVLGGGLHAAVEGFGGLSILGPVTYGWEAFFNWVLLAAYLFWPGYLIGIVLIVLGAAGLRRESKKKAEEVHGDPFEEDR